MKQLSKNFHESEFVCPCCGQVKVDPLLVDVLQDVRDHFMRPVKINSGYRCDIHNTEINGALNSLHLSGRAADIVVRGVSPAKVQQYLADHAGGIGAYMTFTHVDVRGYRARWSS
jgi:uncharacterized protein YcbK (DUF882 family)